MAEFITQRTRHESLDYTLFFGSKADPSWGYGYPCDMLGNVLDTDHALKANALRIDPAFNRPIIELHKNVWYDPATIRCECGATVVLYDAMTNHCDTCGRFYNGSGQLLAHPSQWGEETGEQFNDSGVQVL